MTRQAEIIYGNLFIIIEKIVNAVGILVGDNGIQIYILNAQEDIFFHLRIIFHEFCDKIFNVHSLGNGTTVRFAGSTGIGKFARTLNKM